MSLIVRMRGNCQLSTLGQYRSYCVEAADLRPSVAISHLKASTGTSGRESLWWMPPWGERVVANVT